MDWRNHKFWRKKLFRLDEKTTEFDLLVQEQSKELLYENEFDQIFNCSKGHPPILKKYLGGDLNLETLTIYEKIFSFRKNFDKKLVDPVWETVSLKIKKYLPFLNINVFQYKQILKGIIDE